MQAPSEATWDRGRAALVTEVGRVAALLRSLERPVQPAVGSWNAAEVAVHLSQAFVAVPGLARGDLSEVFELLPGARRPSGALLGDLWDLAGTTVAAVRSEEERRPEVLADRLEQRCAAFLREMDGRAPDEPRGWMVEGVTVPLATLTFHLLSETVVHGWDIARADGRPWAIDPSSAAMAADHFFLPLIGRLGRSVVDQEAGAGVRACFDLRVRGGERHHLVFDDGDLAVEAPSDRAVDCHLSADPAALVLVTFGRVNQWRAIARGQLVAWGRRPWLAPRLRSLLRNP